MRHLLFAGLMILISGIFIQATPPKEYALHEFKDFNGKLQVALSSKGDGKFGGSLTSLSGPSKLQELHVKKNIETNGDVKAKDIQASGAVEASSMTLKGTLKGESAKFARSVSVGDLATSADIKVAGHLNVTREVSSNGDIHSKGSVNAKSINTNGELKAAHAKIERDIVSGGKTSSEEGFYTRNGSVKSKDIEATGDITARGLLKSSGVDVNGEVTSRKLVTNDADTKKLVISERLSVPKSGTMNVDGKFSCGGEATFSNGLKTTGEVSMRGQVDIVGDLSAKKAVVDSIVVKSNSSAKKKIVEVRGGSIVTNDITSEDFVRSKSLSTGEVQCAGPISAKSITTAEMTASDVEVRVKTTTNQLYADTISVKKKVIADESIASSGSLSAKGDCKIGEKLTAKSISAEEIVSTKFVEVKKELSTHTISSKGDISTEGKVFANGFESKGSMTSKQISATTVEVKDTFKAANATLTGDLNIEGNANMKGGICSLGSIKVKSDGTEPDVRTDGDVVVGKDMIVSGDISVQGAINGSSAEFRGVTKLSKVEISNTLSAERAKISDNLIVKGNAQVGCLHATNETIIVGGTFVGTSNISIKENIFAGDSIKAKKVVVSELLNATGILTSNVTSTGDMHAPDGRVISGGGFLSNGGNLECNNVTASGLVHADSGIHTTNLTVNGSATVLNNLSVRSASINERLNVSHLTVVDDIEATSFVLADNMTIGGKLAVADKIFAEEAEVEKQLKAKSLFSARVYTEDMAASGFVTAATIISKGDATVNGKVTADELSVGKSIQSNSLSVTNSIKCVTAEVAGTLNAAGIVARKASVDGIDIGTKLKEIDQLKTRIEELEILINRDMSHTHTHKRVQTAELPRDPDWFTDGEQLGLEGRKRLK